MTDTVAPLLSDVYTLLQAFIVDVTGLDQSLVFEGLDNRVADPPAAPGFIAYQAIIQGRLRTNVKTWNPAAVNPTTLSTQMGLKLSVQIDCYGAASNTWATILQTLLRDEVGCIALAGPDPKNPIVQPLYADDPHMIPLEDSEDQYEQRWSLDAQLQYNPTVSVVAQFANQLKAILINVEATYRG